MINKTKIVSDLMTQYGATISRDQLAEYVGKEKINWPYWISDRPQHRVSRGVYTLVNLMKEHNVANSVISGSSDQDLPEEIEPEKTDYELAEEINYRFVALEEFANATVRGSLRSLIVSGNAGIGKTYTLEDVLSRAADDSLIRFTSIKGYVKATGLYKLLWEHREENCVLLFDDADSIFQDEVALNLLKSALDTTKRRRVAWLSERSFKDEGGDNIPDSFDYKGCIIFVTNLNFDRMSKGNLRLAPHFQALISRSFYMDLNLLSLREMMIRIEQVIHNSTILSNMNLTKAQSEYIFLFMKENVTLLREVSLRMVIKLGHLMNASGSSENKFLQMAKATCMVR
jgi:SpoVK/Ycf46/Vps4 family AAA+-type ATPase